MNDPSGSKWRRWDLQVQTILDDGYKSLSDYYCDLKSRDPEKWQAYVDSVGGEQNALKYDSKDYFFGNSEDEKTRCMNYVRNFFAFLSVYQPNIGLIAITDHNYSHNCLIDTFVEYAEKGTIKVVCGVEINASGVHILALFRSAPYGKPTLSEGIKTFLSKLDVHNPKSDKVLTVSGKSVRDVVKEIRSVRGLYIFPHCNSDNGLFQERGKTDRTYLSDVYNLKATILLQAGSKSSADKVREHIQSHASLKSIPVFSISSDSRCLNDICSSDDDGNFTWIKADPTFEGLRQIVFENNERISVQSTSTHEDYPKPYFSRIKMENAAIFVGNSVRMNSQELQLNPNLVAIIGGRGTGKSRLVDAIAKTFNKTIRNPRAAKIVIPSDDFEIVYKRNDDSVIAYSIQEDNSLDYLHIHQGEVKGIADPESPEKLDGEIKGLLSLPKIDEFQTDYPDSTAERLINEIFDIKDWLAFKDDEENLVNSPEFNQVRKKEKKDLIQTITTEENRQLIDRYIENLKKVSDLEDSTRSAGSLIRELSDFQATKNQEIDLLNRSMDAGLSKVPILDFQIHIDAIEKFIESKDAEKSTLSVDNASIEKSFEEAGIKGDISTLLVQLERYQRDITSLDKKIAEAEEKQGNLAKKLRTIGEIADSITQSHESYITTIKTKWLELKEGKDDWNEEQKELISKLLSEIEIEAEDEFNVGRFYELISEYLNLQKFRETQMQSRDERLIETLGISDQESFKQLLKGEKIISATEGQKLNLGDLLDSDYFVRNGAREFLRICLLSRFRQSFWKVLSKSKYKGKEVYELSVGQRGTFYVCLKLATDPFMKPFIFDQPEDDLDNDFIMHHLVPIFKMIKKYRQVIIVTHNANLVVNADAEQVIVATNEGEVLKYESGAIENDSIRVQVCNILEGGTEAFTRRERKYGFAAL